MYYIMINSNKVQIKQNVFCCFLKILCIYCDLNVVALLDVALCYKSEGCMVSL